MRSMVARHWRKYITKGLRQIGKKSVLIIILILQMQRGTITVKASRREAEIIGTT